MRPPQVPDKRSVYRTARTHVPARRIRSADGKFYTDYRTPDQLAKVNKNAAYQKQKSVAVPEYSMWHRFVDAVRALFGGEKAYQKAYEQAIAANRAIARNNELASRVEFKTIEEKLNSLLDALLKTKELSLSQTATALPGRVDSLESRRNLADTERHELPDGNLDGTIDAAALRDLRREAAGLEPPERGTFLTVTAGGRAIATGKKGTCVPETFTHFAEKHGLTSDAHRIAPGQRGSPQGAGKPIGDTASVALSRQSEICSPSHRSAIEYIAKPLLDGLGNAPPLCVFQSASKLPFTAPADAQGMYLKGVVWLVADNLYSPDDVRNAVAHEMVGHYGMRGFFGSLLDTTLDFIHCANPKIQRYATE